MIKTFPEFKVDNKGLFVHAYGRTHMVIIVQTQGSCASRMQTICDLYSLEQSSFPRQYTSQFLRFWYLTHMHTAKPQASLRFRAVSHETSLLAHPKKVIYEDSGQISYL